MRIGHRLVDADHGSWRIIEYGRIVAGDEGIVKLCFHVEVLVAGVGKGGDGIVSTAGRPAQDPIVAAVGWQAQDSLIGPLLHSERTVAAAAVTLSGSANGCHIHRATDLIDVQSGIDPACGGGIGDQSSGAGCDTPTVSKKLQGDLILPVTNTGVGNIRSHRVGRLY